MSIISGFSSSQTVMIMLLYFGSRTPAPRNALYNASSNVFALPNHSPVDLISGPSATFAARICSYGMAGILTAK